MPSLPRAHAFFNPASCVIHSVLVLNSAMYITTYTHRHTSVEWGGGVKKTKKKNQAVLTLLSGPLVKSLKKRVEWKKRAKSY